MNITAQLIAEYAKEVEVSDPIDFGMLSISEDDTFNMIATSLLDHYLSLDEYQRELMLLATSTKLVVENFVLNLKLQQR